MAGVSPAISHRRRNYMLHSHRRDGLIEFIRDLLNHSFVLDCMEETLVESWTFIETLIAEHHEAQVRDDGSELKTRLYELVPTVGHFHTKLELKEAFKDYNAKYRITQRKFVRPSFHDIRHILNLAQVSAMIDNLKLVTFDGDCTLYADGKNFENPQLAKMITLLLKNKVKCALVTAAGYGYDAAKYETRLTGLLQAFKEYDLTEEECQRFYVLGGECHYLLKANKDGHLDPVNKDPEWFKENKAHQYDPEKVKHALAICESVLIQAMKDLNLRTKIIVKERAIGMIAGGEMTKRLKKLGHGSTRLSMRREALDECVLRLQKALRDEKGKGNLPNDMEFCAFNGGHDVWIDIGNKSVGVKALQDFFKIGSSGSVHIGDQFLNGNDVAARTVSPTIWVINPEETRYILKRMLTKCFHTQFVPPPDVPDSPRRQRLMSEPEIAEDDEIADDFHNCDS